MAQAADFFVSYTSADRAWAEWIAWQLEAEGYQVIVQAWDFGPGRDWVHEMQEATSHAERVVAVLSSAYLASAHGEAEWRVFYAKDPNGERGLLLPVRVGPVDPPGLLKTRVYVDLVDQDAAGARGALLGAARGARGKPTQEPGFPGSQRSAGSAIEAPRFPGELPPIWNVPYHPNPYFSGRDPLLAEIHARLTTPDAASRRVVVTGLGGVGKTQLAVEHAYRQRADYDLVWWVRGQPATSLLADYAALATQPLLARELGLDQAAPQKTAAAAARDWLERYQGWLLILDNAEEPRAVAELLPRSATGNVLLTSRSDTGWEQLATRLSVGVLAPADAAGFLLARTDQTGPAAEAAATRLASTLGGLPLALEQAGAYIATTGTVNLVDYGELFASRASELLNRGQPLGYQHTVATTWSLALQQTEPAAVGLLTLAAFLAPDDLPLPLLTAHAEALPESLASVVGDPLRLGDAVAAVRRFSLVRVIGDGLFVHRLLQTVVREALDTKAQSTWANAAVLLLRAGFPTPNELANWTECERLLPHLLAVVSHGRDLDVQAEASLLNEAGGYLWNRGQYQRADNLFERALASYRRILGDNHPETLRSMNNLATTRQALGDLQGARQLHEQTLAGYQHVLGDNHRETLVSMNNLARTYQALGDLQGARHLHEEALAGYQRLLGDNHPDTLRAMDSLAEARWALGDLQGARHLQEQTLTERQRVLGDKHPDTLGSMNNLAATRWVLGDLQGARHLQEQTLTGLRQVLGEEHPDTLASMNNLAEIRWSLGDLQGARELLEQALAGRQRVLGDDHPSTLQSMNNLAETRNTLGDPQGARHLHEQILATRRRMLGDNHPDTLRSMNNLAEMHRTLGDLHRARQLHEEALAGYRRALGDNHPDTLRSMNNLGIACGALGNLLLAYQLHEQALAGYQRVFGDNHPDTQRSMSILVTFLRKLEEKLGEL